MTYAVRWVHTLVAQRPVLIPIGALGSALQQDMYGRDNRFEQRLGLSSPAKLDAHTGPLV